MSNTLMLAAVVVIVLAAGAYAFTKQGSSQSSMNEGVEENTMMAEETEKKMEETSQMDTKEEASASMSNDMDTMDSDDTGLPLSGQGMYEEYTPEKLALAEDGKAVLFFKASWCPSCRVVDTDIRASLSDIPAGVAILQVDFDDSVELRQKYGVTSQHTFVQVDATGNQLNRWSGGTTLEAVLANLK